MNFSFVLFWFCSFNKKAFNIVCSSHYSYSHIINDVEINEEFDKTDSESVAVDTDVQPEPCPEEQTTVTSSSYVIISALAKGEEYVTITNIGGWLLVSERGADDGQFYRFPSGYTLGAGESVTLIAGDNPMASDGQIVMARKNIWNNSEYDPAILYDEEGIQIDLHE